MAAVDRIATARNEEFSARVLFIATKVAQDVASEDPGAADHEVRANYAGRVIRGTDNPKMIATHVISSNPTIGAAIDANPQLFGSNIPDGDIEFALASIWTARAYAFEGVAG
jgi:hypothetical protein